MPNKILIETSILDKILSFFSKKGASKISPEVQLAIEKQPEIQRLLNVWKNANLKLLYVTRDKYKKNGQDTSEIDKIIADIERRLQ